MPLVIVLTLSMRHTGRVDFCAKGLPRIRLRTFLVIAGGFYLEFQGPTLKHTLDHIHPLAASFGDRAAKFFSLEIGREKPCAMTDKGLNFRRIFRATPEGVDEAIDHHLVHPTGQY